jgi:hypothetical protein
MRPDKYQRQIVLGTVLGDGYLYRNGRLQVEHREKDIEYLLWKHNKLCRLASGIPKRCLRFDKRTNKTYVSWRFYTKPTFKSLRILFYSKDKKVVPRDSKKFKLNPLGLAVWYMDDGGRGARTPKGMIISVRGYSESDRKFLKRYLEGRFSIKVNLHKNGQLYFPIQTVEKFCRLIKPYVVPSMKYKLPLTL